MKNKSTRYYDTNYKTIITLTFFEAIYFKKQFTGNGPKSYSSLGNPI